MGNSALFDLYLAVQAIRRLRRLFRKGPAVARGLISAVLSVLLVLSPMASVRAESQFWQDRRKAVESSTRQPNTLVAWAPSSVAPVRPLPLSSIGGGHSALSLNSSLSSVPGLALSGAYGEIRAVHASSRSDAPIVIHIQDVHDDETAQKNISGFLRRLIEDHSGSDRSVSLVGVEGATGGFNLAPYRQFPDRAIMAGISDVLLSQKLLAGPEHAAWTATSGDPVLWGLENRDLYEANIKAFVDGFGRTEEWKAPLTAWTARAEKLKPHFYSPDALAWDKTEQAYAANQIDLASYARTLFSTLNYPKEQKRGFLLPSVGEGAPEGRMRGGFRLKTCPLPPANLAHLADFVNAIDQEKSLDNAAVESERASLLQELSARLTHDELLNLTRWALAERSGTLASGTLFQRLRQTAEANGLPLTRRPHLLAYAHYLDTVDRIDKSRLAKELEQVSDAVWNQLLVSGDAAHLHRLDTHLARLGRLTQFAISPDDWTRLEESRQEWTVLGEALNRLSRTAGLPADMPTFPTGALAPQESFCRTALARNKVLVDSLLEQMDRRKVAVAVLVAGGFHTEGIEELLKEKGVTCVTFTPKVGVLGTGSNPLESLLPGHAPLDQYLKTETITLKTPFYPSVENPIPGYRPTAAHAVAGFLGALALSATLHGDGTLSQEQADAVKAIAHAESVKVSSHEKPLKTVDLVIDRRRFEAQGSAVPVAQAATDPGKSELESRGQLLLAASVGSTALALGTPHSSGGSLGSRLRGVWGRLTRRGGTDSAKSQKPSPSWLKGWDFIVNRWLPGSVKQLLPLAGMLVITATVYPDSVGAPLINALSTLWGTVVGHPVLVTGGVAGAAVFFRFVISPLLSPVWDAFAGRYVHRANAKVLAQLVGALNFVPNDLPRRVLKRSFPAGAVTAFLQEARTRAGNDVSLRAGWTAALNLFLKEFSDYDHLSQEELTRLGKDLNNKEKDQLKRAAQGAGLTHREQRALNRRILGVLVLGEYQAPDPQLTSGFPKEAVLLPSNGTTKNKPESDPRPELIQHWFERVENAEAWSSSEKVDASLRSIARDLQQIYQTTPLTLDAIGKFNKDGHRATSDTVRAAQLLAHRTLLRLQSLPQLTEDQRRQARGLSVSYDLFRRTALCIDAINNIHSMFRFLLPPDFMFDRKLRGLLSKIGVKIPHDSNPMRNLVERSTHAINALSFSVMRSKVILAENLPVIQAEARRIIPGHYGPLTSRKDFELEIDRHVEALRSKLRPTTLLNAYEAMFTFWRQVVWRFFVSFLVAFFNQSVFNFWIIIVAGYYNDGAADWAAHRLYMKQKRWLGAEPAGEADLPYWGFTEEATRDYYKNIFENEINAPTAKAVYVLIQDPARRKVVQEQWKALIQAIPSLRDKKLVIVRTQHYNGMAFLDGLKRIKEDAEKSNNPLNGALYHGGALVVLDESLAAENVQTQANDLALQAGLPAGELALFSLAVANGLALHQQARAQAGERGTVTVTNERVALAGPVDVTGTAAFVKVAARGKAGPRTPLFLVGASGQLEGSVVFRNRKSAEKVLGELTGSRQLAGATLDNGLVDTGNFTFNFDEGLLRFFTEDLKIPAKLRGVLHYDRDILTPLLMVASGKDPKTYTAAVAGSLDADVQAIYFKFELFLADQAKSRLSQYGNLFAATPPLFDEATVVFPADGETSLPPLSADRRALYLPNAQDKVAKQFVLDPTLSDMARRVSSFLNRHWARAVGIVLIPIAVVLGGDSHFPDPRSLAVEAAKPVATVAAAVRSSAASPVAKAVSPWKARLSKEGVAYGQTQTSQSHGLNLRSAPGMNGAVLGSFKTGTQLTITGVDNQGTWLKVNASNGKVGWVSARYVKPVSKVTKGPLASSVYTETPGESEIALSHAGAGKPSFDGSAQWTQFLTAAEHRSADDRSRVALEGTLLLGTLVGQGTFPSWLARLRAVWGLRRTLARFPGWRLRISLVTPLLHLFRWAVGATPWTPNRGVEGGVALVNALDARDGAAGDVGLLLSSETTSPIVLVGNAVDQTTLTTRLTENQVPASDIARIRWVQANALPAGMVDRVEDVVTGVKLGAVLTVANENVSRSVSLQVFTSLTDGVDWNAEGLPKGSVVQLALRILGNTALLFTLTDGKGILNAARRVLTAA